MYCPNCGKEMNGGKFCSSCGFNVEQKKEEIAKATEVPSKTNKSGVIVVIVAALVVFIISAVIVTIFGRIISNFTVNVEYQRYVEVHGIKIASVFTVIDEKKDICSYTSSSNDKVAIVSYDYCNNLSNQEEEIYIDYLVENEGFSFITGSYKYNLFKKVDKYVITVTIDENDRITYSSNGNIGTDGNQRIEM